MQPCLPPSLLSQGTVTSQEWPQVPFSRPRPPQHRKLHTHLGALTTQARAHTQVHTRAHTGTDTQHTADVQERTLQ